MNTLAKILFSFLLVSSIAMLANADRGVLKRKTNKVKINLVPLGSLKRSISFNLKSGLTYKGSFMLNQQQIGNSLYTNTLISYKKGNTVYILPYKQKILIPDYNPSTGYKLIIRHK
jgi:hypothetical protein